MSNGFTIVSGTIKSIANSGIVATARFYPHDGSGNPVSPQANGSTTDARTNCTSDYVEVPIDPSTGAFTVTLADTALAFPKNFSYRLEVYQTETNDQVMGLGYERLQPNGAAWSMNTDFNPNAQPFALVQPGPRGVQGVPGPTGPQGSGTMAAGVSGQLQINVGGNTTGLTDSSYPQVPSGADPNIAWTKNTKVVTPQMFGAVGDGETDDYLAFQRMFATGLAWEIPYTPAGYVVSQPQVISSSGRSYGKIIAPTGFSGRLVTICNPAYGVVLKIFGLDVQATDVRPNPYTGAATTGIYIGPTDTYEGNTPTPGVELYNLHAHGFSYGVHIATFNVRLHGGASQQNDHNLWLYTTDVVHNQLNDVTIEGVAADSASAYALRIGTSGDAGTLGDAAFVGLAGMGVNVRVLNNNFDGCPVFIDNIYGVDYTGNYHENAAGYAGAAVTLASAGAAFLQSVKLGKSYFSNFGFAYVVKNQVTGLDVEPSVYVNILYSAIQVNKTESQLFAYKNGVALGGTVFGGSGHAPEVQTNFSSGIAPSQLTFTNVSILSDYLTLGSQMAPSQAATTNWYPNALTNDGYLQNASAYGRSKSSGSTCSAIAGTQSGQVFTFTTPAQAKCFNGGDSITSTAGASSYVYSVDYVAGTAILNSSFTGSVSITHAPAAFTSVRTTYGSYTVTLTPATSGTITLNPSFQTATYARNGKTVSVSGKINVSSVSSPAGGSVRLSLPFAIGNHTGGALNFANGTAAVVFEGDAGDSYIAVVQDASVVAAGNTYYFSFTYETN